jgi:phage tail sheath protein FI
MPVAPAVSYPGVYIQEVPSDVRSIVPVETATTAFIGRALRGPVNKPVICNGYADFQRIFGGLWLESSLGYAVNHFFLNGGSKAVIVRVYHPDEDGAGVAKIGIGGLSLKARDPGAWGKSLCVRITHIDEEKILKQLAQQYGVGVEDLFNVTVHDKASGTTETFPNVTVVEGPRRLDKVLEHESALIAVDGALPTQCPPAHAGPESGKNWWEEPKDPEKPKPFSPADGEGNDGKDLESAEFLGSEADKTGIYALEHADIFNLLCIPPYSEGDEHPDRKKEVLDKAAAYCEKRRAMLIVDPPPNWKKADATGGPSAVLTPIENAAIFFSRIQAPDPLRDNQVESFGPGGAVAGIFARTDAARGVWKAPAGLEATLRGVTGLTVPLTDAENGELNPLGINCLRQMPAAGYVVWGARTTVGDDRLASQWKYIPVRRTALYIEESLYRGTQWAVFEPNDEPLWSQLRLNIGVFMHGLFRQGAFQGQSPKDAYFVKCDKTTTTQADIDRGIVNVIVGFAPLKPAEFVVLYIQQMAGQLAT